MPEFFYYLNAVAYCTKHGFSHASIVKNGRMWQVPDPERDPFAQAYPPADAANDPPPNEDGPDAA